MMINEASPLISSSHEDGDHYSTASVDSFHECRSQCSIEDDHVVPSIHPKSSLQQTAWNIAKMCMGTGTLALPYAASQGGYIFNAVGLAIIMLWNLYSMDRLLKCLTLIPSMKKTKFTDEDNVQESIIEEEDEKVSNISTLEKVTFHAFGSWGVRMIDGISLCLYFGIITAYIDAMLGFISETPITTGSIYMDGILLVIVLVPLSCASDLKFLSRFSALGIFVLISVQITLAFSAISRWTEVETVSIFWVDLWPKDWTGVSNWFGIVSFSMGVVPFTYTIQESMEMPKEMKRATETAVWLIFIAYLAISDGLAILVSPITNHNYIEGDILQLFPHGWIPTFVRLAMTLVIIVTAPLIIIPAGDLLESKFGVRHSSSQSLCGGSRLIRIGILLLCACLSIMIHNNFVHIVSFVGCLCVAVMSFVYPPFVHLFLYTRHNKDNSGKSRQVVIQDVVLLFWGCFSSIFTSCQTFYAMIK